MKRVTLREKPKVMAGDYPCSGVTVAAAKSAAAAFATEALTGSYTPELLAYRGGIRLVYRMPCGWCIDNYEMLPDGTQRQGGTCCLPIGTKRSEAVASAAYALAQAYWMPEDGLAVPEFVADPGKREELRSWQRWQLRYRHFVSEGETADVASAMASDARYPYEALEVL